jgi:hypothetical protein
MSQLMDLIKRLDSRLARIEFAMARPDLKASLIKTHYSSAEVAELTKQHGTKSAEPFTIRLACSEGRIPEAEKYADGRWRIPRDAVIRILSVGLPPERRRYRDGPE